MPGRRGCTKRRGALPKSAALVGLVLAGGLIATGQTAAFAAPAATTNVSTDLAGGALSIAVAQQSLAYGFTLDGQDQSQADAVGLEPSDLTGTGDGWSVTVSSTPLESASGQVVPSTWSLGLNGSTSSPSATAGLSASDDGSGTYTLPSGNTATYPVAVPGVHGSTNPTPATVYTAAAGSGMGSFSVPADLWLSAPANASSGTYTATLTWTISQGPSNGVLVPAVTGLDGYSWASSADLVATASSYYQSDVPANAFNNSTSTYWTDVYENYSYSSCTDSGTWLEAQWQGLAQFSGVYVYTENGGLSSDSWTFYVCGSANGGSTWSEIGSATLNVPASPMTELPMIPVTNGNYDALRIDMVLPADMQPLIGQITVN